MSILVLVDRRDGGPRGDGRFVGWKPVDLDSSRPPSGTILRAPASEPTDELLFTVFPELPAATWSWPTTRTSSASSAFLRVSSSTCRCSRSTCRRCLASFAINSSTCVRCSSFNFARSSAARFARDTCWRCRSRSCSSLFRSFLSLPRSASSSLWSLSLSSSTSSFSRARSFSRSRTACSRSTLSFRDCSFSRLNRWIWASRTASLSARVRRRSSSNSSVCSCAVCRASSSSCS
mmetsp:Transcript_26020/g.67007  ORF Transcript_26020/g.67007 Transcript_26020/m.67007 type:complete len:234 (+) Transcript_26020:789-1490(+)